LNETAPGASEAACLPRVFGDYELLEEIARGGMGVVYRARQKGLDRIVAVKMILSGQFARKDELLRFRAEAESAARLQHPNIVRIHQTGEIDGQPYFSMDYVKGGDLAALVREKPLSARRAAGYVKTIAEAIHYAHGQGILHRDLKPSNVLIDGADEPHITDFGLARRMTKESFLTVTGDVMGSPSFMPPEQAGARGSKAGRYSDVYGLGAILFYLLTGRPPFVAETAAEAVHHVLNTEPISPRVLNPSVPQDIATICLKCLEKQPAQRYANAQEVADETGRFLRGEGVKARPLRRLERVSRWCRRNPVVATLAGVVVVAVIAGAAGWLQVTASRQKARTILYASDDFLAQRALTGTNLSEARDILKGLERAIRRQPENPLLWRARGVVLERINELEEAYAHFSRAVELADGDEKRELRHAILLRRSEVLRRMQRVPEAAMDYRRAKGLPYKHIPSDTLPDYSQASTVSIELGATNREQGLYMLPAGDSKHTAVTRDGEEAWFFASGMSYAYCFADPTFKWTFSNAVVRVEYQAVRGKAPGLHYDGPGGAYSLPNYSANKGRTGQWQVIEFILHDTLFRNRQNGGADFRLHGNGNDFYLRRITVSPHQRGRIPSRLISTSSNCVDLTAFYNFGIRAYLPAGELETLSSVHEVLRKSTGIDFDARGAITVSPRGEGRSRIAQTTVPINRHVRRMHFVQSALSTERDGTQIGSYVIPLSDGTREELALIYGLNVRAQRGDYKTTPEAQTVVWPDKGPQMAAGAKVQVFVLTWINPRPDSEVRSVDFFSAETRSTPHLLAITIE
jgi:tetratricopeptide (TPR) repeat protein/predicted Ser/Thr protein kinase